MGFLPQTLMEVRPQWRIIPLMIWLSLALITSCNSKTEGKAETEEEPLSRTEFTERIENYFEYAPLKAGRASQFLIHLTDLADGSPVETAQVTLMIRDRNGAVVGNANAKVGKVTGIYVADVSIKEPGDYDIEFRVKNVKLDERMPLTEFKVE